MSLVSWHKHAASWHATSLEYCKLRQQACIRDAAYLRQPAQRLQALVLHSLAAEPQLPQLGEGGCQLAAAPVVQLGGVEVEVGQGGKLVLACAAGFKAVRVCWALLRACCGQCLLCSAQVVQLGALEHVKPWSPCPTFG